MQTYMTRGTCSRQILFDVTGHGGIFRIRDHLFFLDKIFYDLVDFYLPPSADVKNASLARAALTPILYEIFQKCEIENENERENDALLSVIEYMSESYAEPIDLSSVAQHVGVHPVSLSRMFCARTGIGFVKFLKYLRASAASNLIEKGDMTFTEIAYAVGFGSVRSFNRVFFEVYAVTPTEYRESIRTFNA